MSWIKDLWEILKGNRTPLKEVTGVYLEAIEFLKRELEEKNKRIEQYKIKHPDNGKELDEWRESEHKNHQRIIELLQENRDLRERVIFLEMDLKSSSKKGRSMYE